MNSSNPFIDLFLSMPLGLQIVVSLWLLMFFLRLVDWIVFRDNMSDRFGLYSMRSGRTNALLAWIFHPFIHAHWRHLWTNTLPFLILGGIIVLPSWQEFLTATFVTLVMLNVGIWLFEARNGPTIGASGLITGYFGFILLRGFFTQDSQAIIIAFVVLAIYYGLLSVIFLPRGGNISNVGHFWGFIGGVTSAWVWSIILQNQLVA